MATGIDRIYPPEHGKLAGEIVQNGSIITEFAPGTKPDKNNFPQRNRIISALSLGTLIIESGIPGGSLITARFALDQGKEVFALPGNAGNKTAEGTNFLIQQGQAKLVQNTDDILIELENRLETKQKKEKKPPPQQLSLFEEKIYSILGEEPLHIDVLSRQADMPSSECLVHLLNLEFKGLIMQLPGKMFSKA
jgi:DNA processing protein